MQGRLTIYSRCRRQWTQDRPSSACADVTTGWVAAEWSVGPGTMLDDTNPMEAVHVPIRALVMDAAEWCDQNSCCRSNRDERSDLAYRQKHVVHSYAGVREGTISFPIVR